MTDFHLGMDRIGSNWIESIMIIDYCNNHGWLIDLTWLDSTLDLVLLIGTLCVVGEYDFGTNRWKWYAIQDGWMFGVRWDNLLCPILHYYKPTQHNSIYGYSWTIAVKEYRMMYLYMNMVLNEEHLGTSHHPTQLGCIFQPSDAVIKYLLQQCNLLWSTVLTVALNKFGGKITFNMLEDVCSRQMKYWLDCSILQK